MVLAGARRGAAARISSRFRPAPPSWSAAAAATTTPGVCDWPSRGSAASTCWRGASPIAATSRSRGYVGRCSAYDAAERMVRRDLPLRRDHREHRSLLVVGEFAWLPTYPDPIVASITPTRFLSSLLDQWRRTRVTCIASWRPPCPSLIARGRHQRWRCSADSALPIPSRMP